MKPPTGSNEFGPLLPRPAVDDHVAHGYTATQVNALAVWAARECNWVNGMEMTHRAETAWEAITEHLHLTHERPEETELIAIGWKAMKAQHYQDLRAHGFGGQDQSVLSRAFLRYWTSASAPTHGHEDLIVDRLALAQIWRALTPTQRDALRALAEHGDRTAAARSLNLSDGAFCSALTRARHRFLALWHEHEQPSRLWGADRPGARHQNPMKLLRQRRRKARQRARRVQTGPRARIGRPRRDLGVSDAEILARHEAGESLNALARALGTCRDVIQRRIATARDERAERAEAG
ncbi:hypothetical protein [Nocardiopsis sp. FIRDI 009]|uniref:hypothetical protein n=1 Tax=Nocardiopsis sp. FIRDI 009 TaxID=714197 RepID=UPI000E27F6A4|nr:hypothetical protein [Nocardiopsis sp. FIRDI 009]